jgi:hypothetical protein
MKQFLHRWSGVCVPAALLLPLGVVLFLGATQAQGQYRPTFRPPVFNPPNFNPRQPTVNRPFQPPPQFNPNPNNNLNQNPTQARPPVMNQNNSNPNPTQVNQPVVAQPAVPTLVRVWYCKRCGREVARGDTPPSLTSCPFCGAGSPRFTHTATNPTTPTESSSDDSSTNVGLILGVVAGAALMLALGIALFIKLRDSMPQDEGRDPYRGKKRRRRDY